MAIHHRSALFQEKGKKKKKRLVFKLKLEKFLLLLLAGLALIPAVAAGTPGLPQVSFPFHRKWGQAEVKGLSQGRVGNQ